MKTLIIITAVLTSTNLYAQNRNLPKPVKPTGECIFGENTSELKESKRFKVQQGVIETFKMFRSVSENQAEGKPPMVNVSIVTDIKTGKIYHLNETFRHVDDGDNTTGWLEEVNNAANEDGGVENEGRVVANIGDSDIDHCLVRE